MSCWTEKEIALMKAWAYEKDIHLKCRRQQLERVMPELRQKNPTLTDEEIFQKYKDDHSIKIPKYYTDDLY